MLSRCVFFSVGKEAFVIGLSQISGELDFRSNYFFSPPAHLCAVTYITEILLNVTLSNQPTDTLDQPRSRNESTLTKDTGCVLNGCHSGVGGGGGGGCTSKVTLLFKY